MGTYQIFERFGAQAGGICNVQGPATPPSWLSYVQVADSSRAVSAAKGAGGRLLHGPMEVPGGSWIALFMDPQGGAFAVHEMPRAVKAAAPPKPKPAKKKAAKKTAARKTAKKKAAKKKMARRKTPKPSARRSRQRSKARRHR